MLGCISLHVCVRQILSGLYLKWTTLCTEDHCSVHELARRGACSRIGFQLQASSPPMSKLEPCVACSCKPFHRSRHIDQGDEARTMKARSAANIVVTAPY